MVRKNQTLIFILLLLLLFTTGCNAQAKVDIGDTLTKSEEHFDSMEGIASVASAFDGDEGIIKFRLMIREHPTHREAEKLFHDILDTIARSAGNPDIWEDYQGSFDIKSFKDGVIYKATKRPGEALNVEAN